MPLVPHYLPDPSRYDSQMTWHRCGRSGLMLPAVSLGLWQNFGGHDTEENGRAMLRRAFDLGITHFDLANNYGPPAGSAEECCGRILAQMALAWVLRGGRVTSVLCGASRVEQIEANVAALEQREFSGEELKQIDQICGKRQA